MTEDQPTPRQIVEFTARTKGGMSLEDLLNFVSAAHKADVHSSTVIRVRVGYKSQIKAISTGGRNPWSR
ncbi:hypothetical protein ODZ83_05495 [Acaricomes phytoseiuli]|uniref:hypothetical protein n=1 Tax=Acaricomes phytoseiuli TaxID=291968 RepID=UPI002223A2C6|nr:hypothetical protein [Acaricomes phytoseiuli]MCW1249645.1 hypothetical protein [Acaricomes phytoseiuli]